MAYGHIFDFKSGRWDYTLSFITPGNNVFSKKEVVYSNQVFIIEVISVTIVCIPYYTEFAILFSQSITCKISTPFYTKRDRFFQVS